MIKKIILLFLILTLPLGTALSQDPSDGRIRNPWEFETIEELLEALIGALFRLMMILGPLLFLVAAFYYMTSAGDPEKVKKAQNTVKWTIMGILIALLANAILYLIINTLTE